LQQAAQISLQILMYVAVLVNLFFGTYMAALPAGTVLPSWVLPTYAGFNAIANALPSNGIQLNLPRPVAKAIFFMIALVPLIIAACTPTGGVVAPTTAREALATAEISYTQAAVSANTVVSTVTLTATQKAEIAKADADAGNALNILDDAVMALPVNAPTSSVQNQLQAVQTLVAALTAIVAKDGGK
jgi:hypothetical protein